MEFIISNHATKRLRERKIPNPNFRVLKSCSKIDRKWIRSQCELNGCDSTKYAYYKSNDYYYVSIFTSIGKATLITAFKREKK